MVSLDPRLISLTVAWRLVTDLHTDQYTDDYDYLQEIPENAADIGHFPAIHTDSLLKGKFEVFNIHKILDHQWTASWTDDCPERHKALLALRNVTRLCGYQLSEIDLDVQQIGPCLVNLRFQLNLMGLKQRGAIIQSIFSCGPERQNIVHRFFMERRWFTCLTAPTLLLAEHIMVSIS